MIEVTEQAANAAELAGEILPDAPRARPSGRLVVPFDRRRDARRRYYWALWSYTGLASAAIILLGLGSHYRRA